MLHFHTLQGQVKNFAPFSTVNRRKLEKNFRPFLAACCRKRVHFIRPCSVAYRRERAKDFRPLSAVTHRKRALKASHLRSTRAGGPGVCPRFKSYMGSRLKGGIPCITLTCWSSARTFQQELEYKCYRPTCTRTAVGTSAGSTPSPWWSRRCRSRSCSGWP